MTTSWTIGATVEYANGLQASVVRTEGDLAVLEQQPSSRVPHAFIVAQGAPDEFRFPFEENPVCETLNAAVRQMLERRYPKLPVAFSDFDLLTLPVIPAGFVDTSWGNEACPSFTDESTGLMIYVDYAEPAQREFPSSRRFSLLGLTYRNGEHPGWDAAETEELGATDSWDDLLAAVEKAKANGRTLPDALRAEITDLASGKAWIEALCAAGMDFHLEDSPGTIISVTDGRRLFKRADEKLIVERVAALYALDWGPKHECPIGYMLEVLGEG